MKRAMLIYFSGTGNTEWVARWIEQGLQRREMQVERARIEDLLRGRADVDVASGDLLGIGHPVYGFDAPGIVERLIERLPEGAGKPTFIFKTAGDLLSVNAAASQFIIRQLEDKGYRVFYDRLICMPSNFVVHFPDEAARQMCDAAQAKADHLCEQVLSDVTRRHRPGRLIRSLCRRIHLWQESGSARFGRSLFVTSSCTDCGRCIQNCPADNIRHQDGQIVFGEACLFCLRCVYGCPQQAIQTQRFKFIVLKQGYNVSAIIHHPDLRGDYVHARSRGFWGRFRRYFAHIEE